MADSVINFPGVGTQAQFKLALLDFINRTLPQLHELKAQPKVGCSTPLFESGLIDSLGILHLISFVERVTGKTIPTRMVVMKHFQTVDAIAETFWADHAKERQ